jgi:hypothetical protein
VPMVMNYSHNSINVLKRTIDIEHIIKWLDQFQSHTLKFSSGCGNIVYGFNSSSGGAAAATATFFSCILPETIVNRRNI